MTYQIIHDVEAVEGLSTPEKAVQQEDLPDYVDHVQDLHTEMRTRNSCQSYSAHSQLPSSPVWTSNAGALVCSPPEILRTQIISDWTHRLRVHFSVG